MERILRQAFRVCQAFLFQGFLGEQKIGPRRRALRCRLRASTLFTHLGSCHAHMNSQSSMTASDWCYSVRHGTHSVA